MFPLNATDIVSFKCQMFTLFSMKTVDNLFYLNKITSPFTLILKKTCRYCIYIYKYVIWCVYTIIRYISILKTTIFTRYIVLCIAA